VERVVLRFQNGSTTLVSDACARPLIHEDDVLFPVQSPHAMRPTFFSASRDNGQSCSVVVVLCLLSKSRHTTLTTTTFNPITLSSVGTGSRGSLETRAVPAKLQLPRVYCTSCSLAFQTLTDGPPCVVFVAVAVPLFGREAQP
jgi:hypothetical protein